LERSLKQFHTLAIKQDKLRRKRVKICNQIVAMPLSNMYPYFNKFAVQCLPKIINKQPTEKKHLVVEIIHTTEIKE
jgi:hypothetical protein